MRRKNGPVTVQTQPMTSIYPIFSAITAKNMGISYEPAHSNVNAVDVSELILEIDMCLLDVLILGTGGVTGHGIGSCTKQVGYCFKCKWKKGFLTLSLIWAPSRKNMLSVRNIGIFWVIAVVTLEGKGWKDGDLNSYHVSKRGGIRLFGLFAGSTFKKPWRPYKINTEAIFTLLFTNVLEYCQGKGSGPE